MILFTCRCTHTFVVGRKQVYGPIYAVGRKQEDGPIYASTLLPRSLINRWEWEERYGDCSVDFDRQRKENRLH